MFKKQKLIWLLVFLITFIIFVVWVFNLKTILDEEEIENNLQNIFKQAYSEIKNSLKDMTEGIKTLKDEDLPKLLNDEEVLRLKQKVLEYEKEY